MSSIEKGPIDKGELSARDKAMLEVPTEQQASANTDDRPDNNESKASAGSIGISFDSDLTSPTTLDEVQNKYIQRNIEAGTAANMSYIKKRVERFSPAIEFKDHKPGEVAINSHGFHVNFEYKPSSSLANTYEQETALRDSGTSGSTKELQGYNLTKDGVKDRRGKPLQLNINRLIPEGYKVFFDPTKEGNSLARPEDKCCIIFGRLNNQGQLLTLLHEIGHCQDYETRGAEIAKTGAEFGEGHREVKETGKVNEKLLEELLRSERNAWAFALRTIKPYLDNEPYRPKSVLLGGEPRHYFSLNKKMVLDFIHDYCLTTYSKGIANRVTPKITEEVQGYLDAMQNKPEPVDYGENWVDDIKF